MTISAVCFDLDDTLFDYHEYARHGLRSAAKVIESATGHCFRDELITLYFEDGKTEGTFDQLIETYDLPTHLVSEAVSAFHEASDPLTPFPDAELTLSELSNAYRIGLITDGRGGFAKLHRLGIRGYFDAVLVTPIVNSSKRDRLVFEWVLAEMDVAPDQTTYVGDDPRVDFRVPNQLGMTTVRLRRGRYAELEPADELSKPDYEITTLTDLFGVI